MVPPPRQGHSLRPIYSGYRKGMNHLPMPGDGVEVSRQKSHEEGRVSGDFAIHSQDVLDAALALGELLHNGQIYVGLTHTRLIELLKELQSHREDQRRLQLWLDDNLPVYALANELRDENPVTTAIRIMNDTKTVITAAWPHVLNLWENVSRVLRNAGVLPSERKGDIYPVDYVRE